MLGWNNGAKIEALTRQATDRLAQIRRIDEGIENVQAERKRQRARARGLTQIALYF